MSSKWINNIETIKIMNAIAIILVSGFLLGSIYSRYEIYSMYREGILDQDVFERMITGDAKELVYIVSIIIIYFFKDNIKDSFNGKSDCMDCPLNQ